MELTVFIVLLLVAAIVFGLGFWIFRWVFAEYSTTADAPFRIDSMPPPAAGGRGPWEWPELPRVGGEGGEPALLDELELTDNEKQLLIRLKSVERLVDDRVGKLSARVETLGEGIGDLHGQVDGIGQSQNDFWRAVDRRLEDSRAEIARRIGASDRVSRIGVGIQAIIAAAVAVSAVSSVYMVLG